MGERGVTARDAIKEVIDNPDSYEILRGVLMTRGAKGQLATSNQLGHILKGLANTPVGGLKLRKHHALQHQAVAWFVERIRGEVGEVGEAHPGTHREKSGSNSNPNMNGKDSESCQGIPQGDSPNSPTSPSEVSRLRAVVAEWVDHWRERHGVVSNQLAAAGYAWPADEIEAFKLVSKEKADNDAANNFMSHWD